MIWDLITSYPFERYKRSLQLKRTVTEYIENGEISQHDFAFNIKNYTDPRWFGYGGITELFRGGLYDTLAAICALSVPFGIVASFQHVMMNSDNNMSDKNKFTYIASVTVIGSLYLSLIYPTLTYITDYKIGLKYESRLYKKKRNGFLSYYNGSLLCLISFALQIPIYGLKMKKSNASTLLILPLISTFISHPISTVRLRQLFTGESIMNAFNSIAKKYGYSALFDGVYISLLPVVITALIGFSKGKTENNDTKVTKK